MVSMGTTISSSGCPVAGCAHRTSAFYLIVMLCAVIWLQACQSTNPATKGAAQNANPKIPDEVLARQKEFTANNPVIASRYGALKMAVRMATVNELPPDISKLMGLFTAEGAGSIGLAFAYPTLFSSALVVGGAFLIPGGAYFYFHEKNVWEAISGAMSSAELTREISDAMQDRLQTYFDPEGAPELSIEIIVQAFGLVKSQAGFQHCLVVSAACIIGKDGQEIESNQIRITQEGRSEDAPPPQCARLDGFAEHDARLLKMHLYETPQVLGVMAIDRLFGARQP